MNKATKKAPDAKLLKIKRNSVVYDKNDSFFPARVWKVLKNDTFIIIDCGLHVKQVKGHQLELTDYRGRWTSNKCISEKTHFLGMSKLRGLLKGARRYNPELIPETRD